MKITLLDGQVIERRIGPHACVGYIATDVQLDADDWLWLARHTRDNGPGVLIQLAARFPENRAGGRNAAG